MPMVTIKKNQQLARNALKKQRDFERINVALSLAGVDHIASDSAEDALIRLGRITLHFFGWAHKRSPHAYRFSWEYRP